MPTWVQAILLLGLGLGVPLVFVGPIVRGALRNRRLRQHGVPARATVLELRSTGTKINNEPVCDIVLSVEPDGEPPFQATARQVVAFTSLADLRRGAVVTVKYAPTDRTKVVLAGIGHAAASMSRDEADAMAAASQRLLEELNRPGAGVPANAIVRAFVPTGVVVNGNNPLAKLEVKVLPTAGTPFDATVIGVFGEAGLHKYQPGKEVAVVFDPASPSRVTMDLSRTPTRQS